MIANSQKSKIIDKWTQYATHIGLTAFVGCIFAFATLFSTTEDANILQTFKKYFPNILLILAFIIYMARMFFSLRALFDKERNNFWKEIDHEFTRTENVLDDLLKMSVIICIVVAEIGIYSAKFEIFNTSFLLILLLGLFWNLMINRRIKLINKITSNKDYIDITQAISSWIILDSLLFAALILYLILSTFYEPFLINYPIIQADGVFWIHILLTIGDMVKNRNLYWEGN